MLSYSNRDFDSILQDLIKQIPTLTDKWTDYNKSDLGIVLLQTIAGISAMANFYIDKESNENFIGLAKESKNIESILELIGYQKPLRKCGMATQVFKVNDDPEDSLHLDTDIVFPRGFQIYDNDHKIACFLADELRIRPNEKYKEAVIFQGIFKTKTYQNTLLTGYKFYLPTGKYARDHFRLIIDGEDWELVENAFLELEGGKKFSVHRDAYDSHYILLSNDFESYVDESGSFTIEYILTEGEIDINPLQICNISNSFVDIYGNKVTDFVTTYNKDTFTGGFTEGDPYYERARLQRQLKVMDRLVTLEDYNNFVSSYPGVLDCEISDISVQNSTNPKPYQIDIFVLCNTLNNMGDAFRNELLEKIKNLNDTQVKQISGYIDAVEQDWKNMRSSESFRKRNNKN